MSQELHNKRIAILAADGFEQVELEKPKLALAELLGSGGLESIVGVGGATVSTVHERLAALLSFPAASRALTWKLWSP